MFIVSQHFSHLQQWKPKNLQSKSPKQLSVATNSNSVTESAKATEVCKENDGQVNEEELPTSGELLLYWREFSFSTRDTLSS